MRKERRKREKRVKKKKNENKESGDKVLIIKTKSYLAREAEKEIPSVPVKKVPYPMVPSKKENEQYFTGFLDIFKKLKITIPFGGRSPHTGQTIPRALEYVLGIPHCKHILQRK